MEYLEADRRVRQFGLKLQLTKGDSSDTQPFGCDNGRKGVISDGNIEFQFPPKITNDSRKGSWDEGELRGTEPVAVFSTSGPREMTIRWTYVVDGNTWTIERITKNIRTLRGYFALVRDDKSSRKALVVKAQLWCILPSQGQLATGRIKSVDVKYGETMIIPKGNAQGSFCLRSDITVEFRLWTKAAAADGSEKVQDIEGLADRSSPAWF